MPVYFVANAKVNDRATMDKYVEAAGATLAGHDFQLVAATNEAETIEGSPAGARVVILEFPDRAAWERWYRSDAYQAIIGMRHASTEGFAVLADGFEPPVS